VGRLTSVTVAGVGLATSRIPDAPDSAHEVVEGRAYVHPAPHAEEPGWCGYLVSDGVLHLNVPAAMDWLPVADVACLPGGRWMRVTTGDRLLLVPFELRRREERVEGRWLDADGALLDPHAAAPMRSGLQRVTVRRYAPPQRMERWLAMGGWYRLAGWNAGWETTA